MYDVDRVYEWQAGDERDSVDAAEYCICHYCSYPVWASDRCVARLDDSLDFCSKRCATLWTNENEED